MYNHGRLRDRILFQKKKPISGPIQEIESYEDYTEVWAEVRFLSGRNFYTAKAANLKTDTEFIIRYRTDLNEKMRIAFGNRRFEIEGILPIGNDRKMMTIRAYEIKYDM